MTRSHLCLLAAAVLLGGCDDPAARSDPAPTSLPRWDAPPDYDFVVHQGCGEQSFVGTFGIAVRDGRVDAVAGRDQSARASLEYMPRDEVPTLSDIVALARRAAASGADVAEVVYDRNDGHPRRIDIDHRERAIDDESCYVVRNYKPRD